MLVYRLKEENTMNDTQNDVTRSKIIEKNFRFDKNRSYIVIGEEK